MVELYKKRFVRGEFKVFSEPPKLKLKKVKQIHSIKIVSKNDLLADGIIGEGENLAILTADCMPVLFLGESSSALVHAGWRGLKDGILKNEKLKKLKITRIFLGPHIHQCCYEVTEEFLENFPPSFFKEKNDKYFFSMRDVAMLHLKEAFGNIKIDEADECTHCNHLFHSYRRDKTVQRNWNVWLPNVVDTIRTTS
jgi:YfiH family protein